MAKYTPLSYSGRILYFLAGEKDPYNALNPERAWIDLVDDIEIIRVPGNHITMNQGPNTKIIGRKLTDSIRGILIHGSQPNDVDRV